MLSASHLLVVINSSINFIIYCCVGKKFRDELKQILQEVFNCNWVIQSTIGLVQNTENDYEKKSFGLNEYCETGSRVKYLKWYLLKFTETIRDRWPWVPTYFMRCSQHYNQGMLCCRKKQFWSYVSFSLYPVSVDIMPREEAQHVDRNWI